MIIIIFCIGLLLHNSAVARKVWLAALCVVTRLRPARHIGWYEATAEAQRDELWTNRVLRLYPPRFTALSWLRQLNNPFNTVGPGSAQQHLLGCGI